MSNKVFTLINGEEVHLSPQGKTIPAEEFSQLLEGREMLEKVKKDAEQYTLEVTEEGEKIKEQAQKEGFEEGFRQWAEKIAELEQEITKVHDEVHQLIIPVALNAAKKIVGKEIELNKETVLDIVINKLKAVTQHSKIKIFVNKEDLGVLEENKEKLRSLFEELKSLSLIEKSDVTPGGCIIETEGGIINAQMENQWEILERAFNKLMR